MSTLRASLPAAGLAFAIIMVDGFDLQSIGFLAPEMARNWSVPIGAFGVVFSATLAGSIPGAALAGFVSRSIGLRMTLALCLALFGATTLAAAWANEIVTLAALRFVAGIGLGAAVPVAMSLLAESVPERTRASLTTFALCGQPIGAIAGSAICAHFIPIYGWRFGLLLGGVLPLLLIPVVLTMARRDATYAVKNGAPIVVPAENAQGFSALFGPALLRVTLLLWASAFLASTCVNLIVNWLPSAMRSGGSSLQTSILAVSLFNFGGILGALAAAGATDRYGARAVMPPLFGLAAASMAALGFRLSVAAMCVAAMLSGLSGYGGAVLLGPLAIALYPAQSRTFGVGWMLGVGRAGAAVSAWAAGAAVNAGLPIGRLFWFCGTAAVLVVLCLSILTKFDEKRRNSTRLDSAAGGGALSKE